MKPTTSISVEAPHSLRLDSRKEADYKELRKRMAGAISALASKNVLIRLPISENVMSEDKVVELFMDCVDHSQTYNCRCCHQFLRDTWNLAIIDTRGNVESIWQTIVPPATFVSLVTTLASVGDSSRAVRPMKVFPSIYHPRREDYFVGRKTEGGFGHFYANNPKDPHYAGIAKRHLAKGDGTFAETIKLIWETASMITEADIEATRVALRDAGIARTLDQHRKILDEWSKFADLMLKARTQSAKFWLVVAYAVYAKEDFTHFKNSLVGQLLFDLKTKSKPAALKAYNDRANPLKYQRPQVVKEGNVARAEKLFDELGLAKALERRHGTIEDFCPYALWETKREMPTPKKTPTKKAIFGSLTSPSRTSKPPVKTGEEKMTMSRFIRQVLPIAKSMEIFCPMVGGYYGITAPVHKNKQPLVRFPGELAWYTYSTYTSAASWALESGWNKVYLVTPFPSDFNRPTNSGGYMFLVRSKGNSSSNPGLSLFPEFLVPEVREVRSTIEAHSNKGALKNFCSVVALAVGPDSRQPLKVRTDSGQVYSLSYD